MSKIFKIFLLSNIFRGLTNLRRDDGWVKWGGVYSAVKDVAHLGI